MPRRAAGELIEWRPLTGLLDNRSSPDDMPPFSWRMRQNLWVPEEGKLCRAPGWTKLYTASPYNNQDLHDQMLSLQQYYEVDDEDAEQGEIMEWPHASCGGALLVRDTGRQPITLLFPATATDGARRLFAATESRIYSLNEFTGAWRMIADGYGEGVDDNTCPRLRFYATQNQNGILFTNNFDDPIVHFFDQIASGCAIQAVSTIPDLLLIDLRKASVTWTWRDVTFLADVEMGGIRYENRIVWSNYQDILSWDPARVDTIAGQQDLDDGERILGGAEAGDVFLIYTNRRIWEMRAVGGAIIFTFNKRYTPNHPGEGCLAYRNTLVAVHDTHYYAGADGIYAYNLNLLSPERVPWVHRSTGVIFHDISSAHCDNHVAAYNTHSDELWVSWVPSGSETGCPEQTLAINLKYPAAHTIDHGFTAFTNFRSDTRPTVRDFMIRHCICTTSALNALGYGYIKEGAPLAETQSCTAPDAIYTNVAKVVLDAEIEDWEQESAAATSLCTALDGVRLDTLCGLCEANPAFVMASATDWALKQFDPDVFYREMVDPDDYNLEGVVGDIGYESSSPEYLLVGYTSILRSGATSFGYKRDEKTIKRLVAMVISAAQTTPSALQLRIGYSSQPADPNLENACSVLWKEEADRLLKCFDATSAALHASRRTRPSGVTEWALFSRGYFLYLELKIEGTGGSACFSELLLDVTRHEAMQRY